MRQKNFVLFLCEDIHTHSLSLSELKIDMLNLWHNCLTDGKEGKEEGKGG